MIQTKTILRLLLIFLLLVLGFTNGTNTIDQTLNISLLLYVGIIIVFGISKKLTFLKPRFEIILVIPICLLFIVSSFFNSPSIQNYLFHEPVAETYRTDMDDFLKTYYFMEKGTDYYQSFKTAVTQNAFKTTVSDNFWSWRLPTIFYIWKLLPGTNGISIFYAFIFLASLTLFFAYLLIRTFLSQGNAFLAILSPYLLYPYFHFAVRDTTLLQTEWWGIFPMIIGLYFLSKKKIGGGLLFITVAVLIRELFIIPIACICGFTFIKKDKNWWKYIIPVGILVIVLFIHSQYVTTQISSLDHLLTPRIHTFGKQIVQVTLAFGSWEFFFYNFKPFYIFYLLGLLGILRKYRQLNYFFLSFYIFPLTFLFIGSSIYNDYWGIFYMPIVLISQPLLLDTKI